MIDDDYDYDYDYEDEDEDEDDELYIMFYFRKASSHWMARVPRTF